MRGKSALLAVILILAILLSVAGGAFLILNNNYLIDLKLYPKNAASMDLREEDISIAHYETLRQKMPKCKILWNVPFQDGKLPSDTTEITVDTLSEEDMAVIAYFPELEIVHAENCRDYDDLTKLRQTYPNLTVFCQVTLDGTEYPADADAVQLKTASAENLELLPFLTNLRTVTVDSGEAGQDFSALSQYCRDNGLTFRFHIGGELVETDAQELTVENITDADLSLIGSLTELQTLHMVDPAADPAALTALVEAYPDMDISWEVHIGDSVFQSTDTEIDLSQTVVTDIAEVEAQMEYLPNAETVIFGLCGIDNPDWGNSKAKVVACEIENEDMAAYRDRVRDKYKVVWTVRLGPSIALRTDKDNFMPNHFGVGRLFDDYAYNLRYCEDMVCLDVGHMTLTDISFVSFMPKLKYLILAWTEVQYIEPIRSCKNLIWLELDNSCIRDYSPLVDCTALEDLNIGKTYCDITPITQMTWLKNLYMIFCSGGAAWQCTQALPDTRVVLNGDATVGGGWRRLPNYYDMRDCLGMYYMN
ncbi:MAG: hypothetical protein Q4F81_06345 [Eubacteriales bacterium]|nr:hypothetical protein [Eubacteriales bacterium]